VTDGPLRISAAVRICGFRASARFATSAQESLAGCSASVTCDAVRILSAVSKAVGNDLVAWNETDPVPRREIIARIQVQGRGLGAQSKQGGIRKDQCHL
jgi:hypothetical protein